MENQEKNVSNHQSGGSREEINQLKDRIEGLEFLINQEQRGSHPSKKNCSE